MKPQNKLGGKLDKIKKSVAYESSKKVSDITRVKQEQAVEETIIKVKQIAAYKEEISKLLTDINTIRQVLNNERNVRIQANNTTVELRKRVQALEEGLTFYKEGKHYEKGIMGDKILDKGDKASEVLYG